MSWLADLAGKAESLLEKVDQTAANALQADKGAGSNSGPSKFPTSSVHSETSTLERVSKTHLNHGKNVSSSSRPPSPNPKTSSQPSRVSSQSDISRHTSDDKLFEFLNSGKDKKLTSNRLHPTPPLETSSPKLPKLNNLVFEHKKQTNLTSSESESDESSVDVIESSQQESNDRIVASKSSNLETISSTETKSSNERTAERPVSVSNLELENQLLRKEVESLNEELLSLAKRCKDAQERLENAKKDSGRINEQLKKEETLLRQYQSREDDLREVLTAKDSQLAVLRIRIQESDQELQETKTKLTKFQNENERILRDHNDSSGVQNQVLEDLKTQLLDAKLALKHEQEIHQQSRTESLERQAKLEDEQRSLAETLKSLQKNVVDEKRNANDYMNKLGICENKLSSANHEFRDYKEKAGRILQAKEKVIASLKEGKSLLGVSSGITNAEFEAVCQERDVLRDELHQVKYNMEQMKVDIQEMEQQLQTDSETAQEQLNHLQSLLDDEKRFKEDANHDVLRIRGELQAVSDDHYRQKTALITQIKGKESEIEKLKNQLLAKSYATTTEEELEKRVRALTENLIQKQTVIEALSTEKSSLVLQLERLEMKYNDIQRTSSSKVNVMTTLEENDGGRVRPITSLMPSRISESENVNKAVNEIDKFSIRLGVFVRRYPVARLMLIVYMILLHIWVFIVLLTYQPEIHPVKNIEQIHPHAPQG